jgi:hypothetical protein
LSLKKAAEVLGTSVTAVQPIAPPLKRHCVERAVAAQLQIDETALSIVRKPVRDVEHRPQRDRSRRFA